MKHQQLQSKGFTIIELMIATSVLSVLLLVVSVMMINIGGLYSKGLRQVQLQNTVRTLNDDIAQSLQLTGSEFVVATPEQSIRGYCIGDTRYVYRTNVTLGVDSDGADNNRGLWKDKISAGSCPALPNEATFNGTGQLSDGTNGRELMPDKTRLTSFTVSGKSTYAIRIAVAYGDTDLLSGGGLNVSCAGGPGQKFCATAQQETIIKRRIILPSGE